MPDQSLDSITRLVQQCNPNEVLEPGDLRFVNFDEARGGNVVDRIIRSIRRAPPNRPECKLFAGHRGIGKTSALKRLQATLEKPDGATMLFLLHIFEYSDGRPWYEVNPVLRTLERFSGRPTP